jgi:Tol biopolymer transport system component
MIGRMKRLAMVGLFGLIVPIAAPPAPATAPPALAFASYRPNDTGIFSVDADGTNLQRLTTTRRPAFESQPAYSPDGARIAYVCGNFELCVMNSDGSRQGRLTKSNWPARWVYVDRPTWSPDGTTIAFSSNRDGRLQLYVVAADGSGLTKLAASRSNDADPAWSPDGTKIAFDSYRGNGHLTIDVVNADGTGRRQVTSGNRDAALPAWSADSKRIVYQEYDGDYSHLLLVNADGTMRTAVTSGACDEFDPGLSPSTAVVAFDRNCGGTLGIDTVTADGIEPLTRPTAGFDAFPAWRPATSGPPTDAAAVGPVSVATGDARVVGAYYTWSTRVAVVDYALSPTIAADRRTAADDKRAIETLARLRPETARGRKLKREAVMAFKLDAGAEQKQILAYQADARGRVALARKYEHAALALGRRAASVFDAADDVSADPYS